MTLQLISLMFTSLALAIPARSTTFLPLASYSAAVDAADWDCIQQDTCPSINLTKNSPFRALAQVLHAGLQRYVPVDTIRR
jgi:hypothetical protein